MIRAGKTSEIISSSGHWLILDIGFANQSASCGLMIDQSPPAALQFGETVERICKFIAASNEPVNLVIEAPLSVSFDVKGNHILYEYVNETTTTKRVYTQTYIRRILYGNTPDILNNEKRVGPVKKGTHQPVPFVTLCNDETIDTPHYAG